MCWVLTRIGISTVRTDLPRAAIASDKQAAVHRRAEAESRTYCTGERLGLAVREPCTRFVFFSLYGAGAYPQWHGATEAFLRLAALESIL
jgi:hypothetical protein